MATDAPALELTGDPPQVAHVKQIDLLNKHIAHFQSVGDTLRADEYAAELKNTQHRQAFDMVAAKLVDTLGLTNKVTPDTITYNDAVNYIAKVLHEVAQGVKTSSYQRSHRNVVGVNKDKEGKDLHVDPVKIGSKWDPAEEVIAHLGLTDDKQKAAVQALFQAPPKAA